MKKMIIVCLLLSVSLLFILSGCGGGGGSGSTAPTKAVVKLSTLGPDSTQLIGDIQVTLNLPAGVTVKAGATGETSDRVVVKSGKADAPNTTVTAKYYPTTGAIDIQVVNADGFNPGEFVTVTCDLAAGASPKSTDFKSTGFKPFDLRGNEIIGMTITDPPSVELK